MGQRSSAILTNQSEGHKAQEKKSPRTYSVDLFEKAFKRSEGERLSGRRNVAMILTFLKFTKPKEKEISKISIQM